MENTILTKIQEMVNDGDLTQLEKNVYKMLMEEIEHYEGDNNIKAYLLNVVNYGCSSGLVNGMIYYSDTEEFFKNNFNEIFELIENYEDETGAKLNLELNANNLSWFAFENIVSNLLPKLGIEF